MEFDKTSIRILVVDDDNSLLNLLEEVLSSEGYAVTAASDALQALSLIGSQEFDVILTDINMPGLNGIEFSKRVREDRAEVQIIIMTANATLNFAIEATKLGAFDFLLKPFEDLDKVLDVVERAVQKHLESKGKEELLEQAYEQTKAFLAEKSKEASMYLLVLSGPQVGEKLPLHPGESIFGSAASASIQSKAEGVASCHFKINLKDNNVVVERLDSSAVFRMNGQEITQAHLEEGNILEVGSLKLKLVYPKGMAEFEKLLGKMEQMLNKQGKQPVASALRLNFSGNLRDLSFGDLLQTLSMLSKTGTLLLREKNEGKIYFVNGEIYAAQLGRVKGNKAVFRMFHWKEANFEFSPQSTMNIDRQISGDTQNLILNGSVELDELNRLKGKLPPPNLVVSVNPVTDKSSAMNDHEQKILEVVRSYSRVGDILDFSGLTDLDTYRSLISLRLKNLIRVERLEN